MNSDPS